MDSWTSGHGELPSDALKISNGKISSHFSVTVLNCNGMRPGGAAWRVVMGMQ